MTKRILVFTGEGKGKTTAALGMALRALGHGQRVALIHFVKSRHDVGEVLALRDVQGVDQFVCGLGFLPPEDSPEFAKHRAAAEAALAKAVTLLREGTYQMMVLDEICWAVHRNLVSSDAVVELAGIMPADSSLVLTGRFASEALIAMADTVSEIKWVKHGYDAGIPAQLGIEK